MTFGLIVRNDSSYVQIDSDKPRMCAVSNGAYSSVGGDYIAYVTFPKPITTTEPPFIFIRNDPSRGEELYIEMRLSGVSGNWTGFSIVAGNLTWRPLGKWFAAVFASVENTDYGLRLWSETGAVVYDSGATPVIVTKANNAWTYQGSVQFPDYGAAYYFMNGANEPLASDEYFMINPFSRGILRPQSHNWTRAGIRFNYATNRLQMYLTDSGAGPWTNQGQPAAVFARLPGT